MNSEPVVIEDDDIDNGTVVVIDDDVKIIEQKPVSPIIIDDDPQAESNEVIYNNNAGSETNILSKTDSDAERTFRANLRNNNLMDIIIQTCMNMPNGAGMERVIKKTLVPLYRDSNPILKQSKTLTKLLKNMHKMLLKDPDHKFLHIKTLCEELKSGRMRKKVPFVTLATNLRDNNKFLDSTDTQTDMWHSGPSEETNTFNTVTEVEVVECEDDIQENPKPQKRKYNTKSRKRKPKRLTAKRRKKISNTDNTKTDVIELDNSDSENDNLNTSVEATASVANEDCERTCPNPSTGEDSNKENNVSYQENDSNENKTEKEHNESELEKESNGNKMEKENNQNKLEHENDKFVHKINTLFYIPFIPIIQEPQLSVNSTSIQNSILTLNALIQNPVPKDKEISKTVAVIEYNASQTENNLRLEDDIEVFIPQTHIENQCKALDDTPNSINITETCSNNDTLINQYKGSTEFVRVQDIVIPKNPMENELVQDLLAPKNPRENETEQDHLFPKNPRENGTEQEHMVPKHPTENGIHAKLLVPRNQTEFVRVQDILIPKNPMENELVQDLLAPKNPRENETEQDHLFPKNPRENGTEQEHMVPKQPTENGIHAKLLVPRNQTEKEIVQNLLVPKNPNQNGIDQDLLVPKSHVEMIVSDDKPYDPKTVAFYERCIASYKKELAELEELEVTTDSPKFSPYVLCGKLKEKIVDTYKKICEIKGSTAAIAKRCEIRLNVAEGHHPGPAKQLERFLNSTIGEDGLVKFPDFQDVLQCVYTSNREENLDWNSNQIFKEASALFVQCGQALRKRRQKREYQDLMSILRDKEIEDDDPAEKDPLLLAKLEENKQIAKYNEDQILNRFAAMENLRNPVHGGNSTVIFESDNDSSIDSAPDDCEDDILSNQNERNQNSTVTSHAKDTLDINCKSPSLLKTILLGDAMGCYQTNINNSVMNASSCENRALLNYSSQSSSVDNIAQDLIILRKIESSSPVLENVGNSSPDDKHLPQKTIESLAINVTDNEVVSKNNCEVDNIGQEKICTDNIKEEKETIKINFSEPIDSISFMPNCNNNCSTNTDFMESNIKIETTVKLERLDIEAMLKERGDNFECTVFDIEDPFLVIEISSDEYSDEDDL
ncbi:unnamed protein product [Spodoptera littoralis]|uniref:Daxx histone-binding domain-containing protein n=1 Tax=Spodoptera littoralis TaxID=7109 RepID=A0A9P0I0N1_SPOLI|nr:unnamed protein product [Spodoptera littoralis]CAH1639025.1 unnamed protein product [Spodoptera littoralis]